jgi:hypothetical protein
VSHSDISEYKTRIGLIICGKFKQKIKQHFIKMIFSRSLNNKFLWNLLLFNRTLETINPIDILISIKHKHKREPHERKRKFEE